MKINDSNEANDTRNEQNARTTTTMHKRTKTLRTERRRNNDVRYNNQQMASDDHDETKNGTQRQLTKKLMSDTDAGCRVVTTEPT
jgi:hypothetical protein